MQPIFFVCFELSSEYLSDLQTEANDLVSDTCDIPGHTLGSPQSFYVSCHISSICTPWPHLLRRCYNGSDKLSAFLGMRTLAICLLSSVCFISCTCRNISLVWFASNKNCDESQLSRYTFLYQVLIFNSLY